MEDQALFGGPTFHLVDPGHGVGIEPTCTEAIDRFGRKRDKPPLPKRDCRLADHCGVRGHRVDGRKDRVNCRAPIRHSHSTQPTLRSLGQNHSGYAREIGKRVDVSPAAHLVQQLEHLRRLATGNLQAQQTSGY